MNQKEKDALEVKNCYESIIRAIDEMIEEEYSELDREVNGKDDIHSALIAIGAYLAIKRMVASSLLANNSRGV